MKIGRPLVGCLTFLAYFFSTALWEACASLAADHWEPLPCRAMTLNLGSDQVPLAPACLSDTYHASCFILDLELFLLQCTALLLLNTLLLLL